MTGVFSIFCVPAGTNTFASLQNVSETLVVFGVPMLELRTQLLTPGRSSRRTHQYRHRYTTHAYRMTTGWDEFDGTVEARTLDVKRRWKSCS